MKNMSDVTLSNYNEAEALQQLLQASRSALEDLNERIEQSDDFGGQFTITINGQATAFVLGGPQIAALDEFVKRIASENFYDVDFNACSVTE